MPASGKQILDGLIEYPLAPKEGAADYVFFCGPLGPYGAGANAFFTRHYGSKAPAPHKKFNVQSLEGLVDELFREVTQGGVSHIREIVIVAHGTPQILQLPLINGVTETNHPEFKLLWWLSLGWLQRDMFPKAENGNAAAAPLFQTFNTRRKAVVERLRDDSWITIRACRFGLSSAGLYALYSFFGGRANVYAPIDYQFFGQPGIGPERRFENRLQVHEHFVRQRFLPKDVHTPDRKDAIVKALVDPGSFSEPFAIASVPLQNPPPDADAIYADLVKSLDARRPSALLKQKFSERDFVLTPGATVEIPPRAEEKAWIISDYLVHDGQRYVARYDVYEEIEDLPGGRAATIRAAAHLADGVKAGESVPIQLFFSETENRDWNGYRGTWASYIDAENDPPAKERFDRFVARLNGEQNGVDIAAELVTALQIPALDAPPAVTRVNDPLKRQIWSINKPPLLVKVERVVVSPDSQLPPFIRYFLNIYDNLPRLAKAVREEELMAHLGKSPDSPGTELAAYLDRWTLDELAGFIDYCRAPFKPGRSVYIHHAQQAMVRHRDFPVWLKQRFPNLDDAPLPGDPYSALSIGEQDDYRIASYQFTFNNVWNEVKVSNPPTITGSKDLFADEPIAKKLKLPGGRLPDRESEALADIDSPTDDHEASKDLARLGLKRFYEVDKFSDTSGGVDTDCAEFGEVILKWKELENLGDDKIRDILQSSTTSSGKSYWDILKNLKSAYSFIGNMAKLSGVFKLPYGHFVPVSYKDIVKLIAKEVPAVAEVAWLQVFAESEFVVTIPLTMWLSFLEDQQAALDRLFLVGKVTAAKQWLRALIVLTSKKPDGYPFDWDDIDLTQTTAVAPYYLARYRDEQVASGGTWMDPALDPLVLKRGFDEAMGEMRFAGNDLLDYTKETLDKTLRESGLDGCKVAALIRAGLLNYNRLAGAILRQYAINLLEKLPPV